MSSQFLQENAVGNGVKGFTKVQVDNIHSLSLIHYVVHLVIGDQVSQAMYQNYLDELLLRINWHLLPSRHVLMDLSPQLKKHKSVSVAEDDSHFGRGIP
ncbi:protein Wnt-4a-like [Grus japonensis]|uniref:Protein Wnt-4a-like n=1 Tax=Grus japonensis TaxID=30415 RepID=A0ABC9W406_GRUJA